MKTSDFNFELPSNLIAQTPLEDRTASRLLFLHKNSGKIEHRHFYEIGSCLKKGDLLVLNDSKVIPARLFGLKDGSGGRVQFLLLKKTGENTWETLVKPGRKAKVGTKFNFANELSGQIIDVVDGGNRIVQFDYEGNFYDILDRVGEMPLPEYIETKLEEKGRYQTVYADELGSAAAPTAGLHFTEKLLEKLYEQGIDHSFITLHVGLGTFRPVKVDNLEDHQMHSEHYSINEETARKINKTVENGGRIIAVGTTTCRTLESVLQERGKIVATEGDTSIFLYPGSTFQIIDGLITNFHLPESTLMMLVSAFAGKENVMNAYEEAIREKYRFYSFGDAMVIV